MQRPRSKENLAAKRAPAGDQHDGRNPQSHPIVQLQRAIGNQALQRLLRATDPGAESNEGESLAGRLRARIESRLGTHVGNDVRIHRGSQAEQAAAALRAPAFTVGQDIVLGTRPNERLLAHEAAHTVQQAGGKTPSAGLVPRLSPRSADERQAESAARALEPPNRGAEIAIAPAPAALPFPASRRFKEIWPDFERAQVGANAAQIMSLAKELATAPYDLDDILNHGIELVRWLQRNGEPALAARVLSDVDSVWMVEFVSVGGSLPVRSALSSNDPGELVALGKDAARAHEHEQAFRFFGVANLLLSYYAVHMTEQRAAELEKETIQEEGELEAAKGDPARRGIIQMKSVFPRMIARGFQYTNLQQAYDAMREIYGAYSVLEREALAAGDAKAAAEARAKSEELHKEIKSKYTWGTTQQPGTISQEVLDPVEIAEVSFTETPKGPGLTLHGANNAETDLTQLPGLPKPKEIGNNVQIQNLGALQDALMAQTDFQAEIGREPEIRAAFGNEPVDLNDTKKRQKVWQVMYGVFKKKGAGALGSLMALVGRYLKAYTVHTTYNVRDWGASYLNTDLPTDLAGRAEKDCGVYALTVAWDVYETVKHADSKMDVRFDLTTMMEHVTLVITDKSTGEYYVVNNDFVSPPQKGDPLEQVAPQYGAIRGLPYTVGPAMTMSLGGTKDPEKKFHDDAWTRYLASVDWGLHLHVPPAVEKLRKSDPEAFEQQFLAIQKTQYEKFYAGQETFDRDAKALDPMVTALAPVAGDAAKLAAALGPVVDQAEVLAALFTQLGPAAKVDAGSAKSRALLPAHAQYLFTLAPGTTVHPLARVALAILHLKTIGGTATTKQDIYLHFAAGITQFKRQMDAYTSAGAAGPF